MPGTTDVVHEHLSDAAASILEAFGSVREAAAAAKVMPGMPADEESEDAETPGALLADVKALRIKLQADGARKKLAEVRSAAERMNEARCALLEAIADSRGVEDSGLTLEASMDIHHRLEGLAMDVDGDDAVDMSATADIARQADDIVALFDFHSARAA
jgi:hypothetical protein